MGATESADDVGGDVPAFARSVPEFVDWIVAAVIALTGLAMTVGGTVMTFVVDRALLEEGVQSGRITVVVFERELTEAEMLDFTLEVVFWTGVGTLLTGIALVAVAVAYVLARRRAHRRAGEDRSAGTYRANAVLGAVATAVLSFVPFSPVVGGGVAGYLDHFASGRSTSVGALSGVLAVAPALAVLAFVTGGLFAGLSAVGETGLGIVTAATMLLVVLFVVAYGAGLGALGGFAGGRIAEGQAD